MYCKPGWYRLWTTCFYTPPSPPRAYAKGKVIGPSICRCPQKTGIFRDLQVQASHERHKTIKIGEKNDISVFIPASHQFYTPYLFTTPTEATQLCIMTEALMTARAQALCR